MQSRKKMFQTVTKFLLVLLAVGASLGVLSQQKAQAATRYGVLFASFAGDYEVNGEGTVVMTPTTHETQYVWGGQCATRPANPTRAGYTFDNWYTDQTYTTPFNFSTPINASISVWGRWLKSIEFKAHDESTGNIGGGKITVSGTFPGTSATQVGNSAFFTQNLYESNTYTFIPTANSGYYFKGWSFNDPSNGPSPYTDFTISPMWMVGQYGEINTLYAVFGKMGTETQTWNAYEGETSNFRKEYSVSGSGMTANDLYILEDNNHITQTRWEGLTADGKLPASGNAKFIITLKGNPAVGSYPVVFYDNVSHRIINATIVVKHRVQKWLPVAATCTTAGYNTYWECLECGKCFSDEACTHETTKEAMQVPALEHNYGNWQYLNATQHRHYCSHNTAHYETRNHTWNDGVITTQPTTTAEGVKTYTCTGCGGTKTESIPKIVTTYTIKYHETDNAVAGNQTTSVVYGSSTATLTVQDLRYSTADRVFLGWRVVRESDGKTYVMNKSGKSYFAASIPSGGSLSLYAEGVEVAKTAPAGTVVHFYGQWGPKYYTVMYHETDGAQASDSSQIEFGRSTATKTVAQLNYSTRGRKFLGWRVFRKQDNSWYVTLNGKNFWSKTLPEGGTYYLYKNGSKVAKTTAAGTTAHFYGQWETTYTIQYYEDDNAGVSGSSKIVYGQTTPIKTVEELQYSTYGRKFLGWRAYREKDGTWYVTVNGKNYWSKTLPEGGSYYLYKDGIGVAKTTAAGTTVHFYAQWKDTTYTIVYHETDNAVAGNRTTSVVYGSPTATLTVQDLNYSTSGRTFRGWRVVRDSDGKTYVMNSSGKSYFGASVPKGGSISLYAEGVEVAKTAPAGTIVHFYGQWD